MYLRGNVFLPKWVQCECNCATVVRLCECIATEKLEVIVAGGSTSACAESNTTSSKNKGEYLNRCNATKWTSWKWNE